MVGIPNPLAALEDALGVLNDSLAASAALAAAAERARGVVSTVDAGLAGQPERRELVLFAMQIQSQGRMRPKSPRETVDALLTLEVDRRALEAQREIAAWIAGVLDARVRDVKAAERERDKARAPFAPQAERAAEIAERISGFPDLAARLIWLFRCDALIARFGTGAASRIPAPPGQHIVFERTWRIPKIVTDEQLRATKLPPHWYGGEREIRDLDRPFYDDVETVDAAIAPATRVLRELSQKPDKRELVLTEQMVEQAVAVAQAALLAALGEVAGQIRELVALDGLITKEDRALRYPDGALIFDPALFPKGWTPGHTGRFVKLPAVDEADARIAAE